MDTQTAASDHETGRAAHISIISASQSTLYTLRLCGYVNQMCVVKQSHTCTSLPKRDFSYYSKDTVEPLFNRHFGTSISVLNKRGCPL